ncbi:hypothetical protein [Ramlibacter montanisoli]|uniref:DUF58 domain-containing protein n=1 Tax=Ramlibacter montanisoli TaxID=2732512 RepID=A0A849K8U9_9BURK|nr:hypothetical protein [Ramlibacter montanisoli]NNU44758.1 hypothetical protein [Ramlibacter montanisoli]
MRASHVLRALAALLLLALAGASFASGELRYAAAGVAIFALVEIALALRARRERTAAVRDRSRVSAIRVACSETEGILTIALAGKAQGHTGAPYVLLTRTLPRGPAGSDLQDERPYLELGAPKWSMHGAIREASLTPRLLRLALHPEAAGSLGAGEVRVALPAAQDPRALERALRKVLRGVAFTSERSMPEEEAPEAAAELA